MRKAPRCQARSGAMFFIDLVMVVNVHVHADDYD